MLRKSLVPCVAVAALSLLLVNVNQANAQGRRGGGMGMGGPRGVNDISVAANAAVQKELAVKPEQAEKIKDLSQDVREEMQQEMASTGIDFQGLRDLAPEERTKKMAEIGVKMAEVSKRVNDKFLPKLKDALDATQLKRVHEIAIQAAGAQALLDSGVQNELKVTPEQKDKLVSINKDFQKQLAEVPRQERMTKMAELNEEQLAKSTEVLTKDQQAQFASMKGKPFDVKLLRPAGGGRRFRANAGNGDTKKSE
jgi:outer membrane translocation and assembly module TamA